MSEESATRLYIQYRDQRDEALAQVHTLTQQVEVARDGLKRIGSHVAIPPDGSIMPASEVLAAWIEDITRDTLNAMEGEER